MKKIILLIILFFVLGIITFNFFKIETIESKGSIPIYHKKDLVEGSDIIIKGKVNNILPGTWSNLDYKLGSNVTNTIQTEILIDIEKVYKGIPYDDKTISVKINQGKVGKTKIITDMYPDFIKGEDVILFLSEDDGDIAIALKKLNKKTDYYVLTGMLQGKFKFKEEKNGEIIYINSTQADTLSLTSIENEILSITKDIKKNPTNKLTKEEIQRENKKLFGK